VHLILEYLLNIYSPLPHQQTTTIELLVTFLDETFTKIFFFKAWSFWKLLKGAASLFEDYED